MRNNIFGSFYFATILLFTNVHSLPYQSPFEPKCLPWVCEELKIPIDACRKWESLPQSNLPTVSIIITFHNEKSYWLNRTLASILTNTPRGLIGEMLLIDDLSIQGGVPTAWLKESKIRIIRNSIRFGLIRSRMVGARAAVYPILVFLDAHVETNPNWLEPLLARLVNIEGVSTQCVNRTNILGCNMTSHKGMLVSPQIYDLSNPEATINRKIYGGFSWNLTFKWDYMKDSENTKITSCEPWPTPVISGGIFATWRQTFFQLGAYDEQMDIWGAENIEISLRTWQCHGRLEIVPCSVVGHFYRENHPYNFPEGKEYTVIRNRKRTVMVWLTHTSIPNIPHDPMSKEYLSYFFQQSPTAWNVSVGDLSSRRRLAKQLRCHNFEWYLLHVYPELQDELLASVVGNEAADTAGKELELLESIHINKIIETTLRPQ